MLAHKLLFDSIMRTPKHARRTDKRNRRAVTPKTLAV